MIISAGASPTFRDDRGGVRVARWLRRAAVAGRCVVSTYTAIAAGELAGVSEDVAVLTGHPATSLAQVLTAGTRP